MKIISKLWIGIAALIVLSPLGLILPERFKTGGAWGEWGVTELQKIVGYVPHGLAKLSTRWNAPMPDYALKGWEEKGLSRLSFVYIASAIIGVVLVSAAAWFIGKMLAKKGD